MNNAKTTKRALLSSVIAMLLCFAMLLGTTFAWFTDSATSANNKIVAGKLDVKLNMWTSATDSVEITESSDPIFGGEGSLVAQNNAADTLWEPGKTQVVYLSIENAGTLDLKYKVSIDVRNPADGKDLYKVMQYDIIPDATYGTVSSWANEGSDVVLGQNATEANNVTLNKGEQHYFALAVHMKEDAGNEYMDGKVEFDIAVLAAQLSSESDSFDNSYDSLAPYGSGAFLVNSTTVEATANAGESVTAANADSTFKATATAGSTGKVTATITPTNATESVMDVVGAVGQSLVSYDISVTGHEDGSDVTIEVFVGKNLVAVEVYHKGALMTSGVSYSATTGIVTIVTDDFSPFEIAYYPAGNIPLAKVTKLDTVDVSATLGMGGAASAYTLDTAYKFATTQTYDEAVAGSYAKYHADFVVSADKDVADGAIALVGYYEAYCKDYNGGNWVALVNDGLPVEAGKEIRLLDILFGGDGSGAADPETGLTSGSINYGELCNWIPEFLCGVDMLDESLIGTTITVELRLYEVEYDEEHNSWNKETGEYLSICTYAYTFK